MTMHCLQKLKKKTIALDYKYHLSCLAKLNNSHRSYLREIETEENLNTLIEKSERKQEHLPNFCHT